MNVASLELCRELYEVSGWGNTDHYWRFHKPNGQSKLYTIGEMDDNNARFGSDKPEHVRFREENDFFNAYDCGYLLRKLATDPDTIALEYGRWRSGALACWKASMVGVIEDVEADTPENALAKLAIELFKQKILVKEVS